jgi:hypothetical protein
MPGVEDAADPHKAAVKAKVTIAEDDKIVAPTSSALQARKVSSPERPSLATRTW